MSQWLPSSRAQWIIQGALLLLLGWTVQAYASASAEARLLHGQLEVALDSVETATEAHEVEIERSDSLIALQDVIEERSDSAITEVQDESDEAQASSDAALNEAMELASELPVVQAALTRLQTELTAEREARAEERSVSASELFASQQRSRTLSSQLLMERDAAATEIARLNAALSLSIQESEAWERAAKPGALTQIWKQGRAAAVAVALALR